MICSEGIEFWDKQLCSSHLSSIATYLFLIETYLTPWVSQDTGFNLSRCPDAPVEYQRGGLCQITCGVPIFLHEHEQ